MGIARIEVWTASNLDCENGCQSYPEYQLEMLLLPAGFVWDKDGHLVTSLHVVKGSSDVRASALRPSFCSLKRIMQSNKS